MACSPMNISGVSQPPSAAAAGIRRSRSSPQLRCSIKKTHSSDLISASPVRSLLAEKDVGLIDHSCSSNGFVRETDKRSNWVEMIVRLRDQWRERQRQREEGEEEEHEMDGGDESCDVDYETDDDGIVFDRKSFSRLLVGVPWSETKLFSKLAFLCNMAYVIPEMKADDLQNCYDLRYVTSSLEEKKFRVAHEGEPTNGGPESERRPIRPTVAYRIAASAANYVRTRAKGLLSLGGPDVEEEEEEEAHVAECVASTMTAVVAAEEEAKMAAARDLRSPHSAPCEWFVCDDPETSTRFFVIQGSDSLASWQANLFFEPTKFEGTEVRVHRGIYEAAQGMYEQFMPLIEAHLKAHGDEARLRFTGHSLGGSLSLLVHLMLAMRGAVRPCALDPVVTFGSPFVFCGGKGLLEGLGMEEGQVCSVMLHRDIVPRAFSCTYPNHVVQLLKRLSTFRSHPCLNLQKLLYSPIGQLYILQPDEDSSPPHPLLPPGSALWALHASEWRHRYRCSEVLPQQPPPSRHPQRPHCLRLRGHHPPGPRL
ncbi:hypothetical protein QJS10_CPB20g02029 [Acorus calamus]|uniref:Fungal lipase-type domain-containing protein n=1 Tax=Acorus calamus TaxID=4465 RepID=A0AAV9CBT9_ACOCL|nr:hypothetical protein QJS10_CPB20g02029 [Acorus calamus]